MNWKKALTTVLIVATVTLFVIVVRQHDANIALKQQLGTQYAEKVKNFTNYIQDIQSASDSGESISANHYYSEVSAFPIKTDSLKAEMMAIYDELDNLKDGKVSTSKERKQLSEDLNTLQLNLIKITNYSKGDSMKWYDMLHGDREEVDQTINAFYK